MICGISVPSDSVLTSVKGSVHMIGEEIQFKKAAVYALDGYMIGVEDADSPVVYDNIWDRFVPKAIGWAQGGLDIDTAGIDTLSFYEPGQATVEDIVDVGSTPERIFQHRGLRTVVNNPAGYNFVASNASTYFPVAEIPVNVTKKYRSNKDRENVVLFAASSPLLTDVTVTQKSSVSEETWAYLKYGADFLHQAYLSLIGDIEAGAESPFINILDDLEEELTPAVVEATAGDFDDMVFQIFAKMTFQVTVPGNFNVSSLSLQS